MIARGDIWWADLGEPSGSRPAKRRPVLVVQADSYNATRLATVIVATVTSNTALANLPGNVHLPADATGLPRDSVVNVTQLITLNRYELFERTGSIPSQLLSHVDQGLRRMLQI